MDRRRAGLAVALALVACLARAATQGPPVYTYTGTAPIGSCTGTRVLIDALGTGTYYCNGGTWALITGGGGGAPTTAPYWTGAADAGLSAEHNLGALATGLVLNTAGTPSAYTGASCTLPQLMQNLSASGAPTCFQLRLDQLANPTADIEWVFTGEKVLWDFQDPVDSGFSIHGTEAFLGDLVHIHQHSGNPPAGTDLLHIEATDPDVTGLRISMASSAHQAATITGAVGVTGAVTATSFTGPLTGNSSTATALAADPTACVSGEYVSDIAANGTLTCSTPAGGGGAQFLKVSGSNITNSTTTPTAITGLSFSAAANTEYDFRCDLTHQGTATSGPRFNLSGPASPTLVNIRWQRSTSATAQTQSNDTAFSNSAQTAAITSGGNTTVLSSFVMGSIINGANAGTVQFNLTSSTAGQTVTVYRGSGCTVH